MKKCTKCGIEKPLEEFYFRKKDNRYTSTCKECDRSRSKKYHQEHTDKYKKYYNEHKDYFNEYQKNYYKNNKETLSEQAKIYHKENNESLKEYQRQYYKNNKEHIKEYNKQYKKEKRKNDDVYRLKRNISSLLRTVLKSKGMGTSLKLKKITGLDRHELYQHLLNTFEKTYGVSWDGVVNVEIDHIIPLSEAKTIEDVYKLNLYTNIQLLKKEDNAKKWKYIKNPID